MQYLRFVPLCIISIWALIVGTIAPQTGFAFEASQAFYFYPQSPDMLNRSHAPRPFPAKDITRLPASAWLPADTGKTHYGFKQNHILLKIKGVARTESSFMVDDRYLDTIRVFISRPSEASKNEELQELTPISSPGFKSSKTYILPTNTQVLYLEATTNSALIIPYSILSQKAAQIEMTSATWSLGIFFGLAFFSLLICGFHYLTLRQTSLGLICLFIISLSLYVLSRSNLHYLTNLPLEYFAVPHIQLSLLTIMSICALYIQLHSNEQILAETASLKTNRLFHGVLLLIIAPFIGYLTIQTNWFQLTALRILHLPALILAFVVTSIASGISHKRHPEQSYLLLAWLLCGSSVILEGSEFLGVQHTNLINIRSLSDLSDIFFSITLVFLTFWSMNHSALVQKERIETIQILFDTIVEKNKELEINHARASDIAQEIYRDLKIPASNIRDAVTQMTVLSPLTDVIEKNIPMLTDSLQKLTILSQDLNQTIAAQEIPFNLHKMLERVPMAFQQRASIHQVAIHLEVDQQLPQDVCGDQSLLYKSLLLLVEHRLKNMRNGSIRIHATRSNDPRSPQIHLSLRIEDTGFPYDKASIDQFWSHSPTLASQDFQLILARDMIFAMGGEFHISHEPSVGNCFTAQVIFSRVMASANQEPKECQALVVPVQFTGLHALLVSPQQDPSLLLFLRQLGFHTHIATSYDEAMTTLIVESVDVVLFHQSLLESPATVIPKLRQATNNPTLPIIITHRTPTDIDIDLDNVQLVNLDANIDTLQANLTASLQMLKPGQTQRK